MKIPNGGNQLQLALAKIDRKLDPHLEIGEPRCPLCLEMMKREWVGEPRSVWVFACRRDLVAVQVTDPFVGRWEDALQKTHPDGMKCVNPACDGKMGVFCTSVGFMRAKCRKKGCGAELTGTEPDRTERAPYSPDKPGTFH